MKTGTVFWITGLSGAGKSTLAKELQIALEEKQVKSIILDEDGYEKFSPRTLILLTNIREK